MSVTLSVVAALVVVLLAASAVAKLVGPARWAEAARAIAPTAPRAVAVSVPVTEIAIALLVVVRPAAGLAAAALLLAGFAAGAQLLRPRLEGASCGCFGALAGSRFGHALVWRNAIAAAIAAAASVGAGRTPTVEPLASLPLALAGALAGCALAVVRYRSRPRRGPRLGHSLVVPGAAPGRPLLAVVLAPGCPPCEALAPALRALGGRRADVDVVAVVVDAPDDDAAALAGALDGLVIVPAGALVGAWRIPGTPFAIAVDAGGRVRGRGVATREEIGRLADRAAGVVADTPAEPVRSRREVLALAGRGVAAGSIALAVTGVLPALAAAATRSARGARRVLSSVPGVFYDRHSRNRVRGDCNAFADRLEQKGVYDWDRTAKPNAIGYTWGEGIEAGQTPTAAVCRRNERITRTWRGHCPCPTRLKDYTSESACQAECPSGLACFGYQCVTDDRRVCIDVTLDVCVSVPTIVISVVEWTPTGSHVGAACRRYAANLTAAVRRHELHHALDVKKAVDDTNKQFKNRNAHACGKDEAEARALIDEQIARLLKDAGDRLKQNDADAARTFHGTPEGAEAVLDCPASHCP